jgi:hypothetical protein
MRALFFFALFLVAGAADSWTCYPLFTVDLLFVVADTHPLDVCNRIRRRTEP